MGEPEMKAAGFNSFLEVARELIGNQPFDRFVSSLSPHLADYILRPRLATSWIPFVDVMEIDQRMLDEVLHGDLERVYEMGRRQFKADLAGIYKLFVRLGSVSFIVRRTAVLWGTYTRNAGQMRVIREEPKLVEVEVTEHPFARPGLWHYIRGNIQGGVEASGARGAKTIIVESDDVRRRALIRATWI